MAAKAYALILTGLFERQLRIGARPGVATKGYKLGLELFRKYLSLSAAASAMGLDMASSS